MISSQYPFLLVSTLLGTVTLYFSMAASVESSTALTQLDIASMEEQKVPTYYSFRYRTDDSFTRIPGNGIVSESIVNLESKSFDELEGEFFCVPLTVESLSKLQECHALTINSASSKSASPSVNDLLHIKRTSSLKSLSGVNSDAATDSWLAPASQRQGSTVPVFNGCQAISEAPTESNSTITSSVNSTAQIPASLKKVLEISGFTESLIEYLRPNDLVKLLLSNSAMLRFFKDRQSASFEAEFPSLKGITKSFFALIALRKLLNDPHVKFKEWHHAGHSSSAINLFLFINDRLSNLKSSGPNERFALVNLIELIRSQELMNYSEQLPTPFGIYFEGKFPSTLVFKQKVISIIMKAAHYGHLRILKALVRNIKATFSKELAGQYILDLFLLGTESRRDIPWTVLQRSVHAPTTAVADFLSEKLTEDESVIDAYLSRIKSGKVKGDLPGYLERLMFPLLARQKIKRIIQKQMLQISLHHDVRAIHIAISKSTNPNVLSLFLTWERDFFHTPEANHEDVKVFYQLAFATKSLQTVRIVRQFFPERMEMDLALKSDWPEGLKVCCSGHQAIKNFIAWKRGLLHMLAYHGSVNILKYLLKEEFYSLEGIKSLSEEVDEDGKKPLDIALERGKVEMVKLLLSYGIPYDRTFLIRVLKLNPPLLTDILPDQHDREILAYYYISKDSHVTLLEWSILSKNQEALKWFLATLPPRYWSKVDGAGNTPIHLAVISGNCEAIKLLLEHDPSLLHIVNDYNDTPMQVAIKIRDKTRTASKIEVVSAVIELLAQAYKNK